MSAALKLDDTTIFDCTSCGACCKYDGHVTVMPEDRIPKKFTLSPRGNPNFEGEYTTERIMKREFDSLTFSRCLQLAGTIGRACMCKIYSNRPSVCREYVVGGPRCLAARKRAGIGM